jgi:hypothetical protein
MKNCFLAAIVGLAIGVASPTFAQQTNTPDWNHDSNQGRFQDPAVGSWIIHIHFQTFDSVDPASNPPPPLPLVFDNISAIWEGGITTSSSPDPTQGTSYGVWKRIGPRMYLTKIIQLNLNGGSQTVFGGSPSTPIILSPKGDHMYGPFNGFDIESTGKVLDRFSGSVIDDRITFDSP